MAKNAKKVSLKGANTSMLRWDQRTIGFIVVLIVAVVGTYLLTSSYASPAPKKVGSGTCSTSPATPTVAAQQYNLIGMNIPTNYTSYNEWVIGGKGTVINFAGPDSAGTITAPFYAYYPGSYTAQIRASSSGKSSYILASCSYTIQ